MPVSAVKSEPAPAADAPKPAGKKGLIKLVLIAVIVIAGGGWWYYSHNGQEASQEAKHKPAKPPVFVPLEQFTVNLVMVDNPQFLQTGITLKVANTTVADELKLHMPVVRDRILMLMSSRKAADLLTVEGKRRLGDEIVASLNKILGAAAAKTQFAGKAGEAKGADANEAENDEEEKDAANPKTANDGKDAKDGKAAPAAEQSIEAAGPVQAVLFTTFIIQ